MDSEDHDYEAAAEAAEMLEEHERELFDDELEDL